MSDRVSDYLSVEEMLEQLGEEAAELSHAAQKLARAIRGTNPTPMTISCGWDNVGEEIADVAVCLDELELVPDTTLMFFKRDRWLKRLEELYGKR